MWEWCLTAQRKQWSDRNRREEGSSGEGGNKEEENRNSGDEKKTENKNSLQGLIM